MSQRRTVRGPACDNANRTAQARRGRTHITLPTEAFTYLGRSEVPTQRDRPTQSDSMHVSLRRALRRFLCLTETEIRLTAHLTETVFCLTETDICLSEWENPPQCDRKLSQ